MSLYAIECLYHAAQLLWLEKCHINAIVGMRCATRFCE